MQRRKFIAGMGSLAAAGAAGIGTGAFTSVQAERDITIETAGDASAYLGISPDSDSPNAQYASTSDDGTVSLDFTSNEKNSDTGLNDEAKVNIEDVLEITNNGTQPVYVTVMVEDSSGNTGRDVAGLSEFGISGDDDYDFARTAGDYDGDKLPAGESAGMGFFFNWNGNSSFGDVVNDIDTITLVAAASKDELERFKPSPDS
ncbi:hypothetical protein [Halobacterium rubrum]|uniref:hypothetical protein n=1 Tax=Halobacterium TaxID=2239 RepID=UPI001F1F0893|nr:MULTISPECIES: hypothetical protein [Halobacterium]MDH5018894.1 hypothetical protein [Halobacterium rubrum]